jgi:hypothetical protein
VSNVDKSSVPTSANIPAISNPLACPDAHCLKVFECLTDLRGVQSLRDLEFSDRLLRLAGSLRLRISRGLFRLFRFLLRDNNTSPLGGKGGFIIGSRK